MKSKKQPKQPLLPKTYNRLDEPTDWLLALFKEVLGTMASLDSALGDFSKVKVEKVAFGHDRCIIFDDIIELDAFECHRKYAGTRVEFTIGYIKHHAGVWRFVIPFPESEYDQQGHLYTHDEIVTFVIKKWMELKIKQAFEAMAEKKMEKEPDGLA